jgi:hypothetical protein
MAVTRIKNNQITDLTVNAASKLQDYSVTSGKIANNLTYGSDLTVTGNLTVQGNVTAIDTIDLVVEDPLILLAKEQTGSPTLDIGFIGKRGTEDNIAFVWDESADQFVTVFTSSEITNTTVGINSYASLRVLDITAANADITGNVTFSGNIVGDLGVTGNITGANLNSNAAVTGVTVSASGNLEGNNAVITGDVSSATVTASGNVSAGNVNSTAAVTGVTVTASGNLVGNNAVITGDVSAATGSFTGNVDAGNLNSDAAVTGVTITASGNLVGNNAVITGDVSAASGTFSGNVSAGNISTDGELAVASIVASGNITGGNLISNADVTTVSVTASGNVDAGNINSDAAVTGVTITASGNLVGNNAVITGDVSTTTVTASGNVDAGNLNSDAAITGVTVDATTITATGNLVGNNAVITGDVSAATGSFTGNVDAGNLNSDAAVTGVTITASGNLVGNNAVITGDVSTTTVTATGNITADYFIGDGSQLTGIDVTRIENGNSNVKIDTANGNVTVSVTGTSNVVVFTPTSVEVDGEINASGNVLAANINANGTITGASATITGNVDSGNVNTTGVYAATGDYTGNVVAGNITANADITGVTVTATGNLVGGNANIAAGVFATDVTATGNVNGGNVNTDKIFGNELTITAGNVLFEMTGNIDLGQRWINDLADPLQAYDAATKQYVDDAVSSGITIHEPVQLLACGPCIGGTYAQGGTTYTVTDVVSDDTVVFSTAAGLSVNDQLWFTTSFNGIEANKAYFVVATPNASSAILSTTYDGQAINTLTDGTGLTEEVRVNSGQGATLTNNGTNAALVVDGVETVVGYRILLETQTNAATNGVYVVTTVGDESTPWVLTRSNDMNTYIPNDINGLDAGDYFFVELGDSKAGEAHVMTAPTGPVIIGYDLLVFTLFASSSIYSAGDGLSLTGTVFSVNVDNNTTAIVADNVVVKAGANLVTPNIGDATGNSLTLSGNGLLSATTVVATGNVSGSNLNASAGVFSTTVSASGNLVANNITSNANISGVTVTASGNLVGNNAVITGDVSAATGSFTGNVLAGNLNSNAAVTGVTITASGNLVGNNAVITGDVSAATGSFTGNVNAGNINSDAAVTGVTITASGNLVGNNAVITGDVSTTTVTATGNVDAGNLVTLGNVDGGVGYFTGNVTADTFFGNFAGNVQAGGSNTQIQFNDDSILNGSSAFTFDSTSNLVTVTGNVDAGNLTTAGDVSAGTATITGNVAAGNVNSDAAVTGVTITASGNLVGNNAVITGDVSTTTVTASGNVLAGNVNSDAAITGVTITASGNLVGNNAVITGDVSATTGSFTGNVDAGNLNSNAAVTGVTITASGNLVGNNAVITGDVSTTTVTATGNVAGGNVNTAGQVVATGNITGGNIVSQADVTTVSVTASGNITGGNIETAGQANLGNIRISGDTITGTNGRVLVNSAGDDVNFVVSGDTQVNLLFVDAGSDSVLISTDTATTGAALKVGTTDSILVPVGTSSERPVTPVTGMVRFNTSVDALEFYDSEQWTIAGAEFTVIVADEFIGDNSTVTFTLSEDSTTATTLVAINGVLQIPVTAYSVSGNVLTFTEAPESTDVIDVRILTTTTTVSGINNADNTAAIETPSGGNVLVTGNLIPTADVTYNLGAPDAAWDALYVAGNTIYLGDLQLKEIDSSTFGVFQADGTTSASLDTGNAVITVGGIINANANGVGNIGSETTYFNTVFAKATSAQYADLAEMYEADTPIEPGTVVCFGGVKEVTFCTEDACRRIAGVVSTNPSYLMNSGQTGEYVVAVALQGRVPVKVTGTVRKGDMMVATGDGRARAESDPKVGAVIGKALADFDGQEGVIEVVIGRV